MADLFSLLVQTGNGLGVQSGVIATAGQNVANANTPGYSRQIANLVSNPALGALGAAAVGTGVSLLSITQARDQFVERQIPTALASQAYSQSENSALQSITALNPDLPGGLPSTLGAFYSSLRTLSQNPGDLASRQAVIGSSQALARSFSQTVSSIEDARTGIDARIAGDVTDINATAKQLSALNKQIQIVRASTSVPNDLMDQRQAAVDKLAQLTGGTPYSNGAGDVSIALPGGVALVTDSGAGQLSVAPDPANGGHFGLQFVRADGSGPIALPVSAMAGEVGGFVAARDGAMKTAITSLDQFAFDLGTSLNTIHAAGYAMDGTTGRALFTLPAVASGAASQISVNAAVVADPRLLAAATTLPAASGDNRNILAMIATETQALASGADPVSSLQQIVTSFGSSAAQAKAFADHDGALATHLTQLRDSTSGVSIDEEMINLTKAQKTYEAMAKVISTTDAMLDTLMSLK
jgi:flagellar hook-associated protein 1 FlgK